MSNTSNNRSLSFTRRASSGTLTLPLLLGLAACGARYELGEVVSVDRSEPGQSPELSTPDKIGRVIIDELADLDAPLSRAFSGRAGDVDGDGYDDWFGELTPLEQSHLERGTVGYPLFYGGPRVAGDLYREDRTGPLVVVESLGPPGFPSQRPAGDLDGDGFGDVLHSTTLYGEHLPTDEASGFSLGQLLVEHWERGAAYVQYGGPRSASTGAVALTDVGVPFAPDHAIKDSFAPEFALETDPEADGWSATKSTNLTPLGDLDADGFDDFAYSFGVVWVAAKEVDNAFHPSSSRVDGLTLIYYGSPERLPADDPRSRAAAVLAGVTALDRIGDIDGDGHPELAATKNGRVYALQGGPARLAGSIAADEVGVSLLPPSNPVQNVWATNRTVEPLGDLDADGFDDVLVRRSEPLPENNATYIFYGRADRLDQPLNDAAADATLGLDQWGALLSVQQLGDWDGDGRVDVLLGNNDDAPSDAKARALVIPGGAERFSGVLTKDMLARAPDARAVDGTLYFRVLGDIDGDGRIDVQAEMDAVQRFVKYGGPFESVIY